MIKKGLAPEVTDKIREFVTLNGKPYELHKKLTEEKLCDSNPAAVKALEEMKVLFDYLECYQTLDRVHFDLSLARGLDYYTGVIYEAVLLGKSTNASISFRSDPKIGVGSISAGGRYDDLIGMFGAPLPAVGVSIGVERVFAIMEAKLKKVWHCLSQLTNRAKLQFV